MENIGVPLLHMRTDRTLGDKGYGDFAIRFAIMFNLAQNLQGISRKKILRQLLSVFVGL